jgi:phosphoribosylamine--glycine ligase
MEIALLGHMGRDEAVADRLEGHTLHILGQWENPGQYQKAIASGGQYHIVGDFKTAKDIANIADYVQAIEPDMFITNFDDALAHGIVDAIKGRVADKRMKDLWIPCPDKKAAKVEWDKFYLRKLINEIDPKYNPINFMATTGEQVNEAVHALEDMGKEIAIKPRGLTGGKGVKVQGKHFDTHNEGRLYALSVLEQDNQDGVEVQEKIEGYEFTLQLFTDGLTLIEPPATYDYPYREDEDTGPGTGGMGSFSMKDGLLPFINQGDRDEAIALMTKLLKSLDDRGERFTGVIYPTFFKTAEGLKIVEVNARGGDPELINVVDLMEDDVDLAEAYKLMSLGELEPDSIRFKKLASNMTYLVSPEYGYDIDSVHDFMMRPEQIRNLGVNVRFAAAVLKDGFYQTAKPSRVVGLSALANTPWEARDAINEAVRVGFDHPLSLVKRSQVGEEEYIRNMAA